MNREQRRRQRLPNTLDLTQPHNPDCKTAALVAQLVLDRDPGWQVDAGCCSTCGYRTSVNHETANVWVCLLCGAHGLLDGEAATH